MILRFPVQKIKAKYILAQKLESLDIDPYLQRIFARFSLIKPDNTTSTPIRAIVDTGAVFSLFPGYLLEDYPTIRTESHTMWGIVDVPECHITAKIAKVPIMLIDMDGKESPKLEIVVAFSEAVNIPPLLGMKGLLASYPSSIDTKKNQFNIRMNH